MKNLFCLFAVSLVWLPTGCATHDKSLVFGTVGPEPAKVTSADLACGKLIVFSAAEVNADFAARDPDRPEYSDYFIYSMTGEKLERVHNNAGDLAQSAVPVTLPAGKYVVQAHANGYGKVKVIVMIAAKRTTELHLEGGYNFKNAGDTNADNFVRLPGGDIIGWRSTHS